MKTKLLWCASVLAIVWAMKRYYSGAGADDLWWMLSPTASLAGAMSGVSFLVEPGAGYLSRERLFLIEKSCAGLNFMIAAFAMLTFVFRRQCKTFPSGAVVLTASLLAAWSTAVIVNATRIVIAMWLMSHPLAFAGLTASESHRVEGIAVYFAGLLVLYQLVRRFEYGSLGRSKA